MQTTINAHTASEDRIIVEHWTRQDGTTYYCLEIGSVNVFFESVDKLLEVIHAIERPIPKLSKY